MSAMMQVLDPAIDGDAAEWISRWDESVARLPFAHPSVANLLSGDRGRLLALTMTWHDSTVLYPLVLRAVGNGAHDVISPYGYGGPLFHGDAPVDELASRFWGFFDEWAHDHQVVSEFARLSLFEDTLPHPGRVRRRNMNFVRELVPDREVLWAGCAGKVRQNARRAVRSGVTVWIAEGRELHDEFHRIYSATMERLGSDTWYRFDEDFFARLHGGFPGRSVYVAAYLEGEAVSIDLMLLGRRTAYYFLGGTDMNASRSRPNDLVKMSVMEWLADRDYRWYVLGGGVTPGDGLERYKRGFAPEGERCFRTAERVLDPVAYAVLVDERRERAAADGQAWDEEGEYFPAYRAPLVERTLLASVSGGTA